MPLLAFLIALIAALGAANGDSDNDDSRNNRDRVRRRDNSPTVVIPTPALLPGLVGFGLSILRQRQKQNQPEGDEAQNETDI